MFEDHQPQFKSITTAQPGYRAVFAKRLQNSDEEELRAMPVTELTDVEDVVCWAVVDPQMDELRVEIGEMVIPLVVNPDFPGELVDNVTGSLDVYLGLLKPGEMLGDHDEWWCHEAADKICQWHRLADERNRERVAVRESAA